MGEKVRFIYSAAQVIFKCCDECTDRGMKCHGSCEHYAAEKIEHVLRKGQYIKNKKAGVDIEAVEYRRKIVQTKQKR